VLAGANTYNGGTTINAGTLAIGAVNTLATGGDVTVAVEAKLQVNNNQMIRALSGGGEVGIASTATFNINLPSSGTGSTSTFNGQFSDAGTLVKDGPGALTITHGSPSFSGPITVSSGTLVVTNAGALGATTAGTTVSGPGTLVLTGVAVGAEPVTLAGSGAGGTAHSSARAPPHSRAPSRSPAVPQSARPRPPIR